MLGFTVDTNAAWLATEISGLGYQMRNIRLIDDNGDDIVNAIKELTLKSDLLIITGGLGPTPDDLTREAIAEAADDELAYHPELFEKIEARFVQIGITISESNKKQAYLPESGRGLNNTCGTAPGVFCLINDCRVYAMPGVPREMKEMFRLSIVPELLEEGKGQVRAMKRLQLCGMGESRVGEVIKEINAECPKCEIGTTVHTGVITVRTMAYADSLAEAENIVNPATDKLRERFEDNVYGEEGVGLSEVIVKLLGDRGQKLSLAESCTGGLIAADIVSVAGASEVLIEGVVSYANQAKQNRLGVNEKTLINYGAVSQETVIEMARGSREFSKSDYAIAISGIAGPGGGSEEKPVGTTWIALDCEDGTYTLKKNLFYNREGNRRLGVNYSLDLLRRVINNQKLPEGVQLCQGVMQ